MWWPLPYTDMNQPRPYTCPPVQNPPPTSIPMSGPLKSYQFSSVQFSGSVRSSSLRPHESQHARLPCVVNKIVMTLFLMEYIV